MHLALDPEFAMKNGGVPGRRIGTLDATDVNNAVKLLADIVDRKKIPPKVLVVHRFTAADAHQPRADQAGPAGAGGDRHGRLRRSVAQGGARTSSSSCREPVQYTGFKLFYKNDKPMMTPARGDRALAGAGVHAVPVGRPLG